jgi:3'(2'), 5'-bisphosphate nucleotidase
VAGTRNGSRTGELNATALFEEIIAVARVAGDEVLDVYASDCAAETKADGSPVTEADRRAQKVICARLERLTPHIPIVAEEDEQRRAEVASAGRFWLVDPLDGTKEFLSRNGEFTVNIALIEGEVPILGVVLAPALGRLFAGGEGSGAVIEDGGDRRAIEARHVPPEGPTVVSSRSHGDPEALRRCLGERKLGASISAGSSLKFCLVAAGEADLYPRLGRTMEWATAAGDAIVRAAGGSVTDLEGEPLRYGKPGFENPHFVAHGRDAAWWRQASG